MDKQNYTAKFGIDASEFKRELSLINSNLKNLAAQVKLNAISNADYEKSINTLNDVINENVRKEKMLSDELETLRKNSPQDIKAITDKETALKKQQVITISSKKALEDFKEASEKAKKETELQTVKIDMLSHAMYDLAKYITTQACKALVNFTKETINAGMQFESAFAGVKKVTSGTEEDFKVLEDQIRKTALEKPISADQLSSIYQMGSQLGIAKDGLKDFSDSIIDLAKTSNLTEEAGATMIAQYANVMHLPQEDYRRFASTLSYLGSTTATTESAIMELMSRLSGAGATIGLTHQDLLALATAMGSVGISAEAGGSAISTILSKISMDVDKNSKTLTTWAEVAGMSAEQFKKVWKEDTMSAIQAVIKGMGDAKRGGESLNLILDDLGIKNIRQLDTMRKLANASELLTEDIKKANTEWQSAAFLGESAGKVYDTLEAKTQLLKNSFTELRLSIYDDLKEPLKEVAGELANFLKTDDAKRFASELSGVLKSVVKTIAGLIKALIQNFDKVIAVIKIAASALAGFITAKTISGIVGMINNVRSFATSLINLATQLLSATSAQNALNIAMDANPIGTITTAIGLLVSSIVMFALNTEKATDKTKENTKALEEQKQQILENNEAREKTIQGIDAEYNAYEDLLKELKTLCDENGNVKTGYEDRVNTIVPLLEKATGTEITLINNQISAYGDLIKQLDIVIAKKRLEAKIGAYEEDYQKAIRSQEEQQELYNEAMENRKKTQDEIAKINEKGIKNGNLSLTDAKALGYLKDQLGEYNKQLNDMADIAGDNQKIIAKYEGLIKEQYEQSALDINTGETYDALAEKEKEYANQLVTFQKAIKNGNKEITVEMVENTEKALKEVQGKMQKYNSFIETGSTESTGHIGSGSGGSGTKGSTTKKEKEETKTTYEELLALEKTYSTQLNEYLTKIKHGSAEVTIEMVEETKKKLNEVQSKVKSMKELLGEETVVGKVVLDDESYGALKVKEKELQEQLTTMQSEIAKGNQNVTSDMLDNISKQIDSVQSKMKSLQNEWSEFGNDGEIADDFIGEATNIISKGVIFGKGVLGDNAVEFEGAGKDAAVSYLEGYKKQQLEQQKVLQEQVEKDAVIRANQEALSYQMATIDPANLDIYNQTETFLAVSKQTAQAQGLEDNVYKVVDAETWTLNQAIAAAQQIDFTVVGKYICDGIAAGINANAHVVISAVRAMAAAAREAASDDLEIDSPSKVFYRYGRFVDMGLANGIRDYASEVSNQVRLMTARANEAIGITNSQMKAERFNDMQSLKGTGNTEINYNFTQNNNSNKSLDTLAIYQQSKSLLKRAVRNQYV